MSNQDGFLIFNKELIAELLNHYPEDKHQLLMVQIDVMSNFFQEYSKDYVNDEGFRKAFDLLLSNVLNGTFIGFNPSVENN